MSMQGKKKKKPEDEPADLEEFRNVDGERLQELLEEMFVCTDVFLFTLSYFHVTRMHLALSVQYSS